MIFRRFKPITNITKARNKILQRRILCSSYLWDCKASLSNTIQYFNSEDSTCNSNYAKTDILKTQINQLESQIMVDLQQSYQNYERIKDKFICLLEEYKELLENDLQRFINVLYLVSKYPQFELATHHMIEVYKIVCRKLHTKDVETMNKLLLFCLKADKNVSQSPIFLEFIQFYLQLKLQYYKTKYQLNFQSSIYDGIKTFVARIAQSSFLSRTPPYTRVLCVIQLEGCLSYLISNRQSQNSLMIKKLNYEVFMKIKQFYQQQMHQNLYHPKKKQLLADMQPYMMKIISKRIEMTEFQNRYLRELYIKLYLTLPQDGTDKQLQKYCYLKVVYMFRLAQEFLSQNQDQIEGKELLVQFRDQVIQNFNHFDETLQLDLEQMMLIIKHILKDRKQLKDKFISAYFWRLEGMTFSLNFKIHFNLYFQFLKECFTQYPSNFIKIVQKHHVFSLLSIQQLSQLMRILQNYNKDTHLSYISLSTSVYSKVLSTDYEVIGGKQICSLLQIYIQSIPLKNNVADSDAQLYDQIIALRSFTLRYISDHQREFQISQFNQIMLLLCCQQNQKWDDFNDQHNNYPNDVFQETKEYRQKIQLFLDVTIKNDTKKRDS